jgi:hypothetical protein
MYIPIIDGWSLFFCIAEILTLSLGTQMLA